MVRDTSRAAAVSALFHETEWRGNTPTLQVIDESTWNALQQLAATGLVTFNARASRPLVGEALPPPPKPALTPEQQQRIDDLRAFAARKKKVADVLAAEDLEEEAEPHRKAAAKALEEAEKIENSR